MNFPNHLRSVAKTVILLTYATLLSACAFWPKSSPTPAEVAATPVPPPPTVVAVQAPATAEAPTPVVTALEPLPAVAEPVAKAAAPIAIPNAVAPKASPAAAATLVHGFYINVGLYAVPRNANAAYSKLEKAGLPVFSDVVTKAHGPQTRVRVGPYPTRAKANAAVKKIKALKLQAVVFKH